MRIRNCVLAAAVLAGLTVPALAQEYRLWMEVAQTDLVVGQNTLVTARMYRDGWPIAFDVSRIHVSSDLGLAMFTPISVGRNEANYFRMEAGRAGVCAVRVTAWLWRGGYLQTSVPFSVRDTFGERGRPHGAWWDRWDRRGDDDHRDRDRRRQETRWVQFGDPQRIPGWASERNYFDFTFDNPGGTLRTTLQIRVDMNAAGTADLVRMEFTDGSALDLLATGSVAPGPPLLVDVPAWARDRHVHRVFLRMRGPRGAEVLCYVLTPAW